MLPIFRAADDFRIPGWLRMETERYPHPSTGQSIIAAASRIKMGHLFLASRSFLFHGYALVVAYLYKRATNGGRVVC